MAGVPAPRPWWARGGRFWVAWCLFWVAWGVFWLVFTNAPWYLDVVFVASAALSLFTAGWRVFIINPRLERSFGPER